VELDLHDVCIWAQNHFALAHHVGAPLSDISLSARAEGLAVSHRFRTADVAALAESDGSRVIHDVGITRIARSPLVDVRFERRNVVSVDVHLAGVRRSVAEPTAHVVEPSSHVGG